MSFEFHVHKNVIHRCSSCYKHVIIYYLERSEFLSLNRANIGQEQSNYQFITRCFAAKIKIERHLEKKKKTRHRQVTTLFNHAETAVYPD